MITRSNILNNNIFRNKEDTVSDKQNKYNLWHLFFTYKGRINRQQYIVGWAILLCSYFPLLILTEFIDQFIPLEVFPNLWDEVTPCLLLVKKI